ncbi:MAG: DegV family protein [Eubacteriaceae bacterium]|nr:DegV family protein [Eubacteriaceae bacterium]
MKIKLLADSACDLPADLAAENDIHVIPIVIIKGNEIFRDDVDITRDDIFSYYEEEHRLCTTSALSEYDYIAEFEKFASDYDHVIYICLGSAISSMYSNAVKAASHFSNVHVVDSQNLTTGAGLLALRAADYIRMGLKPGEILSLLRGLVPKIRTSFIINDLDYLVTGGRCSSAAAMGANLLKLKPSIVLSDGVMKVGKKYKGSLEKCVAGYADDVLRDTSSMLPDKIFITYSSVSEELVQQVRRKIEDTGHFKNILMSHTGSTVCCHCGPGTLGIIYVSK